MGKDEIISFSESFRYDESKYLSLDEAEGSVRKGECIVLMGSSGCGKSTLLRTMNRLIPEFYEGELRGYMYVAGHDASSLSIGEAGKLSSSLFQDPRSQFFTLSSSTEVAFGLENFGIPHSEIVERVDAAFECSGLERLRDRNVHELSSGERQLVALLAAKALDTDILLLDEPTANLDYKAIGNLKELLFRLKAEGKTIIISEHRLYYLRDLADEWWRIDNGKIVEKLEREQMLGLSAKELEERGLRATNLDDIRVRAGKKREWPTKHSFKAENVSFSYRSSGKILDGMTISAGTGDVIALVGPNGSGKTTFGKVSSGILKAGSGTYTLDGAPLKRKDLIKDSIFIMQEAEFQFFTNSVMNELLYGHEKTDELKAEIRERLKECGMWKVRNQHPFSLSGGQMQKLSLLLAYFSAKPVCFLDEPTAGLDRESLIAVSRIIERMAEKKAVFIITHDAELIALSCTKAYSISKGKVKDAFDTTTEEGMEKLRAYMETSLEPEERSIKREEKGTRKLDPRTKFFLFVASLVIGIFTDLALISMTLLALIIALSYEKRWGIILSSVLSLSIVVGLYFAWPNVGTSFILYFFPRIILMGTAAVMVANKDEAARSLAAMRRMHVPESWITVFSVVFRFFPVLNKDIGMMRESIRTRGFFPRLRDRLRSAGEYAEILIVPMCFRVMRIAEALSASAETRGIALKNKRESYIALRFTAADVVIGILSTVLMIAGLMI